MAHDNQYKDTEPLVKIERFDCPKKGEHYWNREHHQVEEADEDMESKFLIIKRGSE